MQISYGKRWRKLLMANVWRKNEKGQRKKVKLTSFYPLVHLKGSSMNYRMWNLRPSQGLFSIILFNWIATLILHILVKKKNYSRKTWT